MKKESKNLIELSDGRKVLIRPVSHILLSEIAQNVIREFKERGEPIEPPTYTVTLAGGATQEYTHTEDTLEYPLALALKETDITSEAEQIANRRTVEAHAAWAKHKDALKRLQSEINERQFTYAFDEGIEADDSNNAWDGTIPEGWLERQHRYGFEPPDDPYEKRLWYILRGLLVTAKDQVLVWTNILALTSEGVKNEQVEAALDFFRSAVEGKDSTQ
jgi:hypothetical protein